MEVSLQEELEKEGFGRVKIVKLKNTEMGALELTGLDVDGAEYKLLPSLRDPNLPVMAWPGNMGTDEMNMREGRMNLGVLGGSELSKESVLVGPAVNYSSKAVVDERGAGLWRRVV